MLLVPDNLIFLSVRTASARGIRIHFGKREVLDKAAGLSATEPYRTDQGNYIELLTHIKPKNMTLYYILFFGGVALYLGYMFYMKSKNARLADTVDKTDFKSESAHAERYKQEYLNEGLSSLVKALGQEPVDAFNYASFEYNMGNALKDGLKDRLKGMATLGTVKFHTVNTPKYLVLSGDTLHLLDTDTDGDIDGHLVFTRERLEQSSIAEYPLEGQAKAQAESRSRNVRAWKLTLRTDDKPLELIIYSSLIFTNIPEIATDPQQTIEEIVIATDFLKRLGDCYPHLKVRMPIAG